ncbi:glycosyltransferase [Enterococcus rivorum]|uniref:Glycosyl transferase family 2 n=1 Tax=Enterococcus rivorum TaxID=762845 RepID=A0A1E5KVR4_9ENTE|nr:glycosyltransferase [Enterococcus rivorum]MBP2098399.1 GT2 family glycosyltransferase [Enterococcus rivorum]OEH81928.1 glycosyl transferase family 2 [Enterococcus rivorum]
MENIIVTVLVIYKENVNQTPSYLLLKKFLKEKSNFYLLVYDNSPEKQIDELLGFKNVRYIHNKENAGLAEAYNEGIVYLDQVSGDFLLLLDQDTELKSRYLELALQLERQSSTGAYVPKVISGKRQISPVFSEEYVTINSEKPVAGLSEKRVMAINSGTLLPKETLKKIGRFNVEFSLDFLDHWLFWELYQKNLQVMVLDRTITHDLSVLSHDFVSIERYNEMLIAETNFYKEYDVKQLKRHKKQLFLRTVKQLLLVKNRLIWKRTWQEFYKVMKGK